MSGSNEGVMRNVDALFGIDIGGATSSPSQANSSAQSMRVAAYDGTPVYKSITPPGSSPPPPPSHHPHMNGAQTNEYQQQQMMMMKKKRGRPRKYSGAEGTDGNMSLALMPHPPPPLVTQPAIPASSSAHHLQTPTTTGGGEFSPASGGGSEDQAMFKKARGRPPGSTNKIKKNHQPQHHHQLQPLLLPLGSPGVGFTPHVILVKAGEDVSSKIMSFSQNGPRAVCILSANGSISNVTLRQTATSGGTATYEGRFEILSLCGSFLLTEVAGHRSRTGGLSVSLAGPDGRVLGGCVAGLLTAASPIQVIVGSFIPDGKKELMKTVNHTVEPTHNFSSLSMPMPMSMPPMLFSGNGGGGGIYAPPPPTAGVTSGSPLSQAGGDGSFDEESSDQEEDEEGGSPPDHGTGGTAATNNHHHINNGNPHAMLGMPWR